MPDDQPQISQDVISALIPVTGQSSSATPAAAPIRFEDLSQFLGRQQQTQSAQQTQTTQTQLANLDSKTESSLAGMQPDFRDRAQQWIQAMRDNGYNPSLYFGYRSPEEQQSLYEKYLAGGNKAVAPPMSYHTYGRAFDWVNQGANGELEWKNDKAYEFGQNLATKFNLRGIGSGDNDHIQDANFKTWRDLPKAEYGRQTQLARQ
jgi:LAS superfamily LD-carboxypeptidase LdcB